MDAVGARATGVEWTVGAGPEGGEEVGLRGPVDDPEVRARVLERASGLLPRSRDEAAGGSVVVLRSRGWRPRHLTRRCAGPGPPRRMRLRARACSAGRSVELLSIRSKSKMLIRWLIGMWWHLPLYRLSTDRDVVALGPLHQAIGDLITLCPRALGGMGPESDGVPRDPVVGRARLLV